MKRSKLIEAAEAAAVPSVADIRAKAAMQASNRVLRAQLDEAMRIIAGQESAIQILSACDERRARKVPTPTKMKRSASGVSAILVLSDWHVEEPVAPETVNGLNEYSTEIAQRRAATTIDKAIWMIDRQKATAPIDELVVALLGDFISGYIHDEHIQHNSMAPLPATLLASDMLEDALAKLAKHTKCRIRVVCHDGNHSRTTKKQQHSTRAENSFEHWMYVHLRKRMQSIKADWHISKGQHSSHIIAGKKVRFQHGDAMKSGGGIGGLWVPANRAFAQWNSEQRSWADLDFFGHFHQWSCVRNQWYCNGSMIGFSPFALRIRAKWEPPMQTLVFLDGRKYGVTEQHTIFCE